MLKASVFTYDASSYRRTEVDEGIVRMKVVFMKDKAKEKSTKPNPKDFIKVLAVVALANLAFGQALGRLGAVAMMPPTAGNRSSAWHGVRHADCDPETETKTWP